MAKLFFYYSAMNAGKSTTLLQSHHNYLERGMQALLYTAALDHRSGEGIISSRIGLKQQALTYNRDLDLFQDVVARQKSMTNLACILIDEAQFLSKAHVLQLCNIADKLKLPVLAYGLRTDFRGDLFEGSQYLLAYAEELVEIKTICVCGRKATMNLRIDDKGQAVLDGDQIEVGGNESYIALCRRCFSYRRDKIASVI
ncbi:MAG TPA: thymidine kinase [Gammaproteobacteria bacterium]|nr:thymidine kinase [Gammaproteobacteria bacterium]